MRDDNDPYDIDRFIFSLQGNLEQQNTENIGNTGGLLTPDLNVVVGSEVQEIGDVHGDDTNASNEQHGDDIEEGLASKVNGTFNMAKVVGITNLEMFEDCVERQITEERFQAVDK